MDLDRFWAFHRQIDPTLKSIEREREGLSHRLEEARTRTASLMGNEDGIYFERDPEDEARLVEAEAQMMAAYHRLEQLDAHRTMIIGWREDLHREGIMNVGRSGPGRILAFARSAITRHIGFARRVARYAGWAVLVAIAYATLSGIEHRPGFSLLMPNGERSLAFLATAVAFAIGYPRQRLFVFFAGLAAIASLELAQVWVPSRHGTVQDALAKAAGLSLGFILVMLLERYNRSTRLL